MSDSDQTGIPLPEGPTDVIQTEYEVGQDNIQKDLGALSFDIHNPVFTVSGLVIVLFVILTLALQNEADAFFNGLRGWLTSNLDWFFLLSGNIFVLVCLSVIILPWGSIRIGGRDATPDFSYLSWLAMLFAAGMGIGLMFYGVAEPLGHYDAALAGVIVENGARVDWAPLSGAVGNPEEARRLAMAAAIFHWGLHPWAIYGVVALGLALFSYNKGLPLTMRSIFYPIFGERVWGWPGHVIDILAVFAILFGLATSLGLGAQQANAGLSFLFDIPDNNSSKVVLIIVITAIATLSVVAGLDAGVKRLSELNMVFAGLLLLFVVLAGPTLTIINAFVLNLGAYFEHLPALSNPFGRDDDNFRQGWTAFYWAWWISWSPFVGMFIARVSRGRTVREFMIAVLVIPPLVSVLWMTGFGGMAISLVGAGFSDISNAGVELQLFAMLSHLPIPTITSIVGIILVVVFFCTSSDSGSLVIDAVTAGGKTDAPLAQRIFWATFEGLVAIALLLGGGLVALQAAAVSTGFPFTIILLVSCYALIRGLMSEPRAQKETTAT